MKYCNTMEFNHDRSFIEGTEAVLYYVGKEEVYKEFHSDTKKETRDRKERKLKYLIKE